MEDKPNLPFTEAVIQEILRISCIAPMGLPHNSTADIRLENGYIIPKDTMIFPNLHRITRNSQVFEDPNAFKPERFLYASVDLISMKTFIICIPDFFVEGYLVSDRNSKQ